MTTAANSDAEQLQNQLVGHLQEELDWFKDQIFGKKSDRIASDLNKAQMMFEGFESLAAQDKEQTQAVYHPQLIFL
jgi:Transposase C of IS166 homeodomain